MVQVNKKLLLGLCGIAAAIALIVGLFSVMRTLEVEHSKVSVSYSDETPGYDPDDGRASIYHEDTWYIQREQVETWLLMGVDKFDTQTQQQSSYRNNQQADFFLLLVMDHGAKTCTPIQINRDTMAQIRVLGMGGAHVGTVTGQLALAHTYGSGGSDSCRNTVDAVSGFLMETKIDHYVSVTMDAVALLNDALDGVTVTVLDDFSGIDDTLRKGETVTLRGQQALTYVRTRKDVGDSSNLARQQRQQQYMQAFYQRFMQLNEQDEGVFAKTLLEVSPYMVSDCTVEQLGQLVKAAETYGTEPIVTIEGQAVKGKEYMEFYADEQALTALLLDILYEPEKE